MANRGVLNKEVEKMIYYEVICNVLEPDLVVRRRKERAKSLGELIDLLQEIEEMKKLYGDIEFVRVEKVDTMNVI